jgi:AraC-like DNA-binding protein
MGVFVAPRQIPQRLWHIPAEDETMDAQWVFLDVEINRLYKLDDLYDFPTLLPSVYNQEIFELIAAVRAEEGLVARLPALHRIVAILLECATPKLHVPEEINRLRSYVENHYMNPITPEDLARVLHCSRSAMYRRFREYFGVSPSHYINSVRLRRARFLLTETDRPVGEVAAAVGIPDVFYFARLFRSFTGETAGEYRRKRL